MYYDIHLFLCAAYEEATLACCYMSSISPRRMVAERLIIISGLYLHRGNNTLKEIIP
jgi:hypothetical protein